MRPCRTGRNPPVPRRGAQNGGRKKSTRIDGASGTLLARGAAYAKFSGAIRALCAFRADFRTRRNHLHRTDPLFGRTDGGGNPLCAAARPDGLSDRTAALAAECRRCAAAGRGRPLLSGPPHAGRLDAGGPRPAPRGRPPAAAPRREKPLGAALRTDRLRPVAGAQRGLAHRHAPQSGAVRAGRHRRFRRQHCRAAARPLLHADGRPGHGGLRPRPDTL